VGGEARTLALFHIIIEHNLEKTEGLMKESSSQPDLKVKVIRSGCLQNDSSHESEDEIRCLNVLFLWQDLGQG